MQFLPTSLKHLPAQSVRLMRVASVAAVLTVMSQSAMALPEAIELDRYLLAAGSYLEENRLDQVAQYLEKIEALSIQPPPLYHYYKAQVLREKGDNDQERQALEDYVSTAGKEGDHYQASLVRITELEEESLKSSEDSAKMNDAPLLAAFSQDRKDASDKYAERLKSLYLTDTFSDALVEHINTLLATHRYVGKRLQSDQNEYLLAYSVSVANGESILVVEKDGREKPARLTTDKTKVYGQNPFLKHECDYLKASCTIKKPDMYTPWITLGYNEEAAKEISVALSHLLQHLQRGEK